jgi:ankyrin repeat protein
MYKFPESIINIIDEYSGYKENIKTYYKDNILDKMVYNKNKIIEAVINNNLCFIKKCIDNKINIDISNDRDDSILILAIMNEYIDMIKLIINYISDINDNYNYDYMSPLHLACEIGNIEIVQLLLENGADIDVLDNYFMTPLHYASNRNHFKTIKLLIKHKAKINVFDDHDRLPIHLTTDQNITKYLLDKGSYINYSEYKI